MFPFLEPKPLTYGQISVIVLELLLKKTKVLSIASFDSMLKEGEEGFPETFRSWFVKIISGKVVPEKIFELGACLPGRFKLSKNCNLQTN